MVKVVPDPKIGRSELVVPTTLGLESVHLVLDIFGELKTELRFRSGDMSVDQLRRALEAEWGDPPL